MEMAVAEWRGPVAAIGRGPVVVTVHLPLTAGDDDDRRLPDRHMHRRRREKARAVGLGLSRNA